MTDEPESEAVRVYMRFRRLFSDQGARRRARRRSAEEPTGSAAPFGTGRDPRPAAQVLDGLVDDLGWAGPLTQSTLIIDWLELVGDETAGHAHPEVISDGVLVVRCESTAWATQLRIMRSDILARIARDYPDAGVSSIRFQGPDVPSWKKGPRSISGRGPRDTYG